MASQGLYICYVSWFVSLMSRFADYDGPRSGAEITLSGANKVLMADFVAGIDKALFSPDNAAITVQGTGDTDKGIYSLPQPNYLARLAFLRLENAHTDRKDRPFKLAVMITAHLVDVNQAISMPEDEIKRHPYGWPDGIRTSLLDLELQNIHHESICFQPNLGVDGEFDVADSASGFKPSSKPSDDIVNSAYGITTGLGAGGITNGGLFSHLEPYKVTVDVLQRGEHDPEATDTLDEATLLNDGIRILPEDSTAAERSRPYLYAMFRAAVATPSLRDMIAWQQYWYERSDSS